MPIVRVAGKLVYFAHVPRCAGTSIELYLAARFGPPAFRDARFDMRADPPGWTRSSPQHVAAADLNGLFPPGFFDASFAVVRHPAARLKSVFLFQRDIERRIARGVSFSDWLGRVAERAESWPYQFDNHVRPMDEIVPEGATIFRLEAGLDSLVAWLDGLAGAAAPDLVLQRKNGYAGRTGWAGIERGPEPLTDAAAAAVIGAHYARDFERFGYDPDPKTWNDTGPKEEPA